MTLDAEHEPAVAGLQALDQLAGTAGRTRVRDEPRREVGRPDGLVVEAVHLDHAAAHVGREQDPGEPRTRFDTEWVRRRAGMAVEMLDQRAPGEHVDRLEA